MEVGAVKQAFNNEVILLKKNLNQAKIQIIHKLTRKAKQLSQKKAPEKLQEKLKRKGESAVKEVLLLKKIKARDVAKFIITHTGDLTSYLNKPQVNNDKACARLLLHKAMQEKYKFIRNRFSNVPIKDLFMSRQERLKLRKEEKEKQKNKNKGKKSANVTAEGDWNVEDISEKSSDRNISMTIEENSDEGVVQNDSDESDEEQASISEPSNNSDDNDDSNMEHLGEESDKGDKTDSDDPDIGVKSGDEGSDNSEISDSKNDDYIIENSKTLMALKSKPQKTTEVQNNTNDSKIKLQVANKKKDVNKNRNLKEKIQHKTFKKTAEENAVLESKVVDPFFITSSGEHYMSVAEPRQPDEIKEIHKQGNRKLRRAKIFGHEIKYKPLRNSFQNNNEFKKYDRLGRETKNKIERASFNDRKINFNDDKALYNSSGFSDRTGNFNNKHRKFNEDNDKFNEIFNKAKDEKLHPSWEAKKRQSGILPFKGKKIVFNEG